MTATKLRKVLGLYEAGAGLGGLWMLFQMGPGHGSPLERWSLFGAIGAYFALLAAAGILLGYGRPLGKHLSVYAQWCQVPYLVTKSTTYTLCTPAFVLLAYKGEWLGLTAGFFNIDLAFGRPPDERGVGLNLLALVVIFLVSYGPPPRPRTPDPPKAAA